MDRMQVDVELRDIKQRRAMQVQENERKSQIAKYKTSRNKVGVRRLLCVCARARVRACVHELNLCEGVVWCVAFRVACIDVARVCERPASRP